MSDIHKLCKALQESFEHMEKTRYRDRRAYFATSNLDCARDQYWKATGEKPTNPPDMIARVRMFIGDALDKQLTQHFYRRLHYFGYHVRDDQVPVGGSNPAWDGYIDCLLDYKELTGEFKGGPIVVEIKTKSGKGADYFYNNPEPDDRYLTQIGLYMKDLVDKGEGMVTGYLVYLLLSDAHFGTFVIVECEYKDGVISAKQFNTTEGKYGNLKGKVNLEESLARWKKLDEHLASGTTPAPEYVYRKEVTPEVVKELSDYDLQAVASKKKVLGDWQVKYSSFKDKQISEAGLSMEHTDAERMLCAKEYMRRHPRSKIWDNLKSSFTQEVNNGMGQEEDE